LTQNLKPSIVQQQPSPSEIV